MGGRKMGIQYLLGKTWWASPPSSYYSSPWPWASCRHPRTLSFRVCGGTEEICEAVVSRESWFGDSSEVLDSDGEFSAAAAAGVAGAAAEEAVIRALQSEPAERRLFFEPGEGSSILEGLGQRGLPFEESVAMAVDSEDPYSDFRVSMEEMVAAHGQRRDWAWLEELLEWYLQVNGKTTHRFIVGAFVDLLLDLSYPSSASSVSSSTTSSSSSPSRSISFDVDEEEDAYDQQEETTSLHR
ncbi:unnamed protein product [Spirodela intermedia]|uniref:Transcription repressor n=1 Tax=Spirodela intermedia TaxID=51605 RepID=A0A7I8L324_SPIIN|nr:unnamed protein product [Spirodela intermedia]